MSLVVKKFINRIHHGNLFLVCSEKEFLIIDPCVNFREIEPEVKDKRCVGIFLTHAHFDHFEEIASFLSCKAPLFLHKNAVAKFNDPALNCGNLFDDLKAYNIKSYQLKMVGEGDQIKVGKSVGTVLEVAGHSDCSIGLLIEGHFFCGDFIFAGRNIGRYDLPTGSGQQLRQSLRRLKTMDPELIVHPGHYEDFLLKDY